MEFLADVNWIAAIAGTVVAFLAGWLWYSEKLFGTKWAEGSRVELGSADSMPMMAMVSQLIALLFLAILVGITAASSLGAAIVAILTVAAFTLSSGSFVKKSTYALGVDVGYIILSGVIMMAAQALL